MQVRDSGFCSHLVLFFSCNLFLDVVTFSALHAGIMLPLINQPPVHKKDSWKLTRLVIIRNDPCIISRLTFKLVQPLSKYPSSLKVGCHTCANFHNLLWVQLMITKKFYISSTFHRSSYLHGVTLHEELLDVDRKGVTAGIYQGKHSQCPITRLHIQLKINDNFQDAL